jgi:hypothetical protein
MVITHFERVNTQVFSSEDVPELHFLTVLNLTADFLLRHFSIVQVFESFLLFKDFEFCTQSHQSLIDLSERLVIVLFSDFLTCIDHFLSLRFFFLDDLFVVNSRFVLNQKETFLELTGRIFRVFIGLLR